MYITFRSRIPPQDSDSGKPAGSMQQWRRSSLLRPRLPEQEEVVLLGKYTMDALLLLLPGEAVLQEMVALAREGDDWLRAMSEAERSGDVLDSLLLEVQEGARALTHTRVTSAQFVELLERAGGGGAKYIENVGLVRLGPERHGGINSSTTEEAQKRLDATFVELAARLASLSSDYSAAAAAAVCTRTSSSGPAAAAAAAAAAADSPAAVPSEQFQSFSRRLRDEEVMRLGEQQRHLQVETPSSSEKLMAYLEERMAAASLATPSGPDFLSRLGARRKMLSPEQEEEVQGKIFGGGPESEVLVSCFNVHVTREKIRCLRPGVWLNDEVVNFYMQLLLTRDRRLCTEDPARRPSHFFNSFFLEKLMGGPEGYSFAGVKRWPKKAKIEDVFDLDKIFFPVNLSQTHWCLAVVFMAKKRIQVRGCFGGCEDGYSLPGCRV
jgi:hypothetical protein